MGEHLLCKQGVTSSNLVFSTNRFVKKEFSFENSFFITMILIRSAPYNELATAAMNLSHFIKYPFIFKMTS